MKYLIAAALAGTVVVADAQAQDVSAGEQVFAQRCRTCHMIVAPDGETLVKGGMVGPNLHGIIGQQAASVEDYTRYGDSLKQLGETGFEWTEEELAAYLEDPREYLREKLDDPKARSNMAYKLADEAARNDVSAYLATFGSDS